jgi:Dynein heavy chain AAA lid domain
VYDFNDSDLDAAIKLLGRFMDGLSLSPLQPAAAVLPVDSLVFITGSIVYGGRVTDDWDRYVLQMLQDQLVEHVGRACTSCTIHVQYRLCGCTESHYAAHRSSSSHQRHFTVYMSMCVLVHRCLAHHCVHDPVYASLMYGCITNFVGLYTQLKQQALCASSAGPLLQVSHLR